MFSKRFQTVFKLFSIFFLGEEEQVSRAWGVQKEEERCRRGRHRRGGEGAASREAKGLRRHPELPRGMSVLARALLGFAVLCFVVLCYALLCCALLYYAVLYCALLCFFVL